VNMTDSIANPYVNIPRRAFWRTGMAAAHGAAPAELYQPKWSITRADRIATAGSCFAQHISRILRTRQFNVLDMEPAPPQMPSESHAVFGYGLYSARYGNIYSARQLRQLAEEAFGLRSNDAVWEREGRYYDALRPGVEPDGLTSVEEVIAHRSQHLAAVRKLVRSTDVFVFTFGLTEAWVDRVTGTVFPVAPGIVAGHYDPDRMAFHNFSFEEVKEDFIAFQELVRRNSDAASVRFLVTVSPVPLTATASSSHVLPATVYSKAVLRAVAGDLWSTDPTLDYFPSFEIICNPWNDTSFYASNRRSVTDAGVRVVMDVFLAAHGELDRDAVDAIPAMNTPAPNPPDESGVFPDEEKMRVVCEEQLLEIFGRP
jgi:hypothetical protein